MLSNTLQGRGVNERVLDLYKYKDVIILYLISFIETN